MKVLVVACILAMLVAVSKAVVFEDCESNGATVSSIQISECDDDAEECTLYLGNKYDFTVTFTASSAPEELTAYLTATTDDGGYGDFELDNPDVCEVVGGCSFEDGTEYTYTTSFEVAQVPTEPIKSYVQIFDGESEKFLCAFFKARVEEQE